MKQGINSKELLGRQIYVPASVEVIEISAQSVLCESTPNSLEQYDIVEW